MEQRVYTSKPLVWLSMEIMGNLRGCLGREPASERVKSTAWSTLAAWTQTGDVLNRGVDSN